MSYLNAFYRPEWTAGRFNSEHRVAIYYNLLAGMAYYFEDDSALVICSILSVERNGIVSIQDISKTTGIPVKELLIFFNELVNLGLLAQSPITSVTVCNYRKALSEWKINNIYQPELKSTKEKLPFVETNAEMAYAEKAGGVTSVLFELTYNCSEKCIHCYNMGATRNDDEVSHRALPDEMTLDDYKSAIDQLYEAGLIKVILSGGDPFSKKCIWEIIDYLYHKGIAFDIYTNGQKLIGKELQLANYYPRVVGVSLYSGDLKVHDQITRIKGSFEKSIKVLECLSELAVPLNIKCCVMQPNLKTYRQINDIAKRLGAYPQFELNVVDSVDGDKCVSKYLRLTPEQYEIVLRDVNTPMYVGPEAPKFGKVERDMNKNGCGAAETTFCISPRGDFTPCCSFPMAFGNIKTQSLNEILKSKLLKEWRDATLLDYEECGDHDYCGYCNLCPGLAYSEHLDWKKASENCCYLAKIRYNLANMLKNGNDPIGKISIDDKLRLLDDYKYIKISRNNG